MAFDPQDLSDVKGLNKGRTLHHYQTNDSMATVLGAGYFNAAKDQLRAGDSVLVTASDGEATVRIPIVHGGVVAVAQGMLAAPLTPDAIFPGSVSRATAAKLRERVSVLDVIPPELHAAIRDGESTDDVVDYFEAAQAAAKRIIVPEGRYYLGRAIRNVSNRTWQGDGPGTILYNPQTAVNTVNRCGFMLGNMHPAAFDYASPDSGQFPSYAVSSIAKYDSQVTCTTASQAGNFVLGQFVWVRDQAETAISGVLIPHYLQLNKVRTAGDPDTGVVALVDPIHEAISSPCISPIGATIDPFMGYEWEIVENVTIRDIVIDARAPFSTRTGAYNCLIENIDARSAELLLAVNTFVKTRVRGMRGNWTARGVEIKCGSQDVDLEDIHGHCYGSASAVSGFGIGEQSNRIRARGIRQTIGSGAAVDTPAMEINGWDITVEDSVFANYSTYSGGVVGHIKSNSFTGYGPKNVRLRGVRLYSTSNRTHHLRIGISTESLNVVDPDIDVTCEGATSSGRSIKFEDNTRGVVRGSVALPIEVSSSGAQPAQMGLDDASQTKFPRVIVGSGAPNSAVLADSGSLYLRLDNDQAIGLTYVKTGGLSTTGWHPLIAVTGFAERTADATLNTSSGFFQYWTACAAERTCTLPAQSAALSGMYYWISKAAATVADLVIKNSGGDTLSTIAAADGETHILVWTGSIYRVVGVMSLS